MKWFKKHYEKLPRPIRTAIHLGLLPLVALVFYIVIRIPIYSGTMALRMAEKANMVGPGRILGIVEHFAYPDTQVIVAEDADGYIFCRYYPNSPFSRPQLAYREKQSDLALVACPFYLVERTQYQLPVLLLCNDARADYVEVDLSITIPHNDTSINYSYHLAANRTTADYFELSIDIQPELWTEEENRALDTFSRVSQTNFGIPYSGYDIRATVTLFSNSQEYRTEELTITSIAEDAVERFGNP